MRWSTVQLLQSADDENGLTACASGWRQGIGSSPRPTALARGAGAVRAVPQVPRVLHARTAGAGTRSHHALFERGESAAPGAAAARVLHAPGAIGFGAARAGIDDGQRANGEQDHSG